MGAPNRRSDLARVEVGAPVPGHQQHAVSQVQSPLSAGATVSDLVPAALSHDADELAELAGSGPVNCEIHSDREAVITRI